MPKSEIYLIPMTVKGEVHYKCWPTIEEAIKDLGDVIPILHELKDKTPPNEVPDAI